MDNPSRPQVQRYDLWSDDACAGMEPSNYGQFVRFDDHASSLAAKDAAIGELVEALADVADRLEAVDCEDDHGITTEVLSRADALLAKHSATAEKDGK